MRKQAANRALGQERIPGHLTKRPFAEAGMPIGAAMIRLMFSSSISRSREFAAVTSAGRCRSMTISISVQISGDILAGLRRQVIPPSTIMTFSAAFRSGNASETARRELRLRPLSRPHGFSSLESCVVFEPSRGNFCSLRGAFHLGHVNFPLQTPERVSVGAEQNSVEFDAIAGHRTASSCLLSLGARGICIPTQLATSACLKREQ